MLENEFNEVSYAEQSVIGSFLINGKCFKLVRGRVRAADFAYEAHREIFNAACALDDESAAIDPVVILERMKTDGTFYDKAPELVRDLMNITPTSANAEEYCRIVVANAERRRVVSIANSAIERINTGESVRDVAGWLRNEAIDICDRTSNGGLVSNLQALNDFRDYRLDVESGKAKHLLPSGYRKLDDILGGGFVKEGLYIIAARTANGKTTFALNMVEKMAKAGKTILFVSLEMSVIQLMAKRISGESGVPSKKILNSRESTGELWKQIHDASAAMSDRKVYFNKIKNATVGDIEKLATQIKDLDAVFIDYFGLLRHTDGKVAHEKAENSSRQLKLLAGILGVQVFCLSQINREAGTGEPELHHLRATGALEQDADGVILLYMYPNAEVTHPQPHPLKVKLAKNRHGEIGAYDMNFYLANGRILET